MSLAIKQARFASQGGRSGNVQAGGFLGSLVGGFKKFGLGLARNLPVVGAPIRAGEAVLGALGTRGRPTPPPLRLPQAGAVPPPSFLLNGGAPGRPAAAGVAVGTTIACPSGFHANKSSYFTLAGYVQRGTRCVRNRRRNPMNPRALDRAISRVESGKRLQSKLASITTAKYTASGTRKHPHG